jgi:hypothetical protein
MDNEVQRSISEGRRSPMVSSQYKEDSEIYLKLLRFDIYTDKIVVGRMALWGLLGSQKKS